MLHSSTYKAPSSTVSLNTVNVLADLHICCTSLQLHCIVEECGIVPAAAAVALAALI